MTLDERNVLVLDNLRLAWRMAGRERLRFPALRELPREDSDDAAVFGLVVASRRYDPSRGVPFGAYAKWWILNAMQELHRDVAGVACTRHDNGVSAESQSRRKVALREQSIRHPAVQCALAAEDDSPRRVDDRQELDVLLRCLDRRTRRVLRLHIGEERTMAEIAGEYGISRERIRTIVSVGLDRVRSMAGRRA